MTSRIRRLPEGLVNRIAAGEVVERPASVVKELVENALDAGAGAVAVDLRDGGAALIRVTDDGGGMLAEELPLALERHATSKLPDDEALGEVVTLGFRGEALPAICAVSRFAITSRPPAVAEGHRLAGEGGIVRQRLDVPAEAGTTVEVRDLFFNTPARLKFLKGAAAETSATLRALTALAVAHPRTQFRVVHNGRAVITAPAASDLRERLGALWGWEVAPRLLAVDLAERGVAVRGLVSPPDLTRGHRDDVLVVVNGRPVRDPALLHAVLEAYRPLLPRDRFPLAALHVSLAPADVDANVHPTKALVRFRAPRLVHELLVVAVREALRQAAVVPELHAAAPFPGAGASAEAAGPAPHAPEQAALFAEPAAAYGAPRFGRVLGQVQDTFIVSASETEVFFVDQHVAHERVVFERLESDARERGLPSQALLFPEPLGVGPVARVLLERWREPLTRLGFAFETAGSEAILLTAVPTVLGGEDPARLVEAAVDDLGSPRAGGPALERALAFVACRAAVKADTPLAREEMERIVGELSGATSPFFCPHGRPIVSRVSLADVRKELRRTW